MNQLEINEQIYDILKCLVHSSDLYSRDEVDLNAVAFLRKLGKMVVKKVKCPECGVEHYPYDLWGEYCNSECYDYHTGHKYRGSVTSPKGNVNGVS